MVSPGAAADCMPAGQIGVRYVQYEPQEDDPAHISGNRHTTGDRDGCFHCNIFDLLIQ
jgi:hypothetical protein